MSIQIFYHIACLGSWESIVKTQLSHIIFSGLYDEVDTINCYILGCGHSTEFNKCINLLQTYGKKIIIRKTDPIETLNECFTISDIFNHIQPETKLLYLHTKGVTRFNTATYNDGTTTYDVPNLYNNIMDWNNVMEYFLIKNYKQCLTDLDNFDVIGINYIPFPFYEAGHFSGNFWWATGRYFLTLPKNVTDIIGAECSICYSKPKYKQLFNTGLAGYGHYLNGYYPSNYIDLK